ncbi:MAG: cytochrome oxidase subunit III [Alphaproteobacteria bacterium]|jgi:hypothetical protein
MSNTGPSRRNWRFQLWGWIFFTLSAIAYIISSYRAGDMVSLLASLFFFFACMFFFIPFLATSLDRDS